MEHTTRLDRLLTSLLIIGAVVADIVYAAWLTWGMTDAFVVVLYWLAPTLTVLGALAARYRQWFVLGCVGVVIAPWSLVGTDIGLTIFLNGAVCCLLAAAYQGRVNAVGRLLGPLFLAFLFVPAAFMIFRP